jgi:hypothetical protein
VDSGGGPYSSFHIVISCGRLPFRLAQYRTVVQSWSKTPVFRVVFQGTMGQGSQNQRDLVIESKIQIPSLTPTSWRVPHPLCGLRSRNRLPCRSPPSPKRERGVQLDCQRPTGVQNRSFFRVFSATQPRKGNRVIETFGAGDGNRTHVRTLGRESVATIIMD